MNKIKYTERERERYLEDGDTQRTVSMTECQAYEGWTVLTERVERIIIYPRIINETQWYK